MSVHDVLRPIAVDVSVAAVTVPPNRIQLAATGDLPQMPRISSDFDHPAASGRVLRGSRA